jgi:hypothetical protein
MCESILVCLRFPVAPRVEDLSRTWAVEMPVGLPQVGTIELEVTHLSYQGSLVFEKDDESTGFRKPCLQS